MDGHAVGGEETVSELDEGELRQNDGVAMRRSVGENENEGEEEAAEVESYDEQMFVTDDVVEDDEFVWNLEEDNTNELEF